MPKTRSGPARPPRWYRRLVRLITLATRLALRISALVAVLITLVASVSVLIRKLTPQSFEPACIEHIGRGSNPVDRRLQHTNRSATVLTYWFLLPLVRERRAASAGATGSSR
jgi:hypothetical protein